MSDEAGDTLDQAPEAEVTNALDESSVAVTGQEPQPGQEPDTPEAVEETPFLAIPDEKGGVKKSFKTAEDALKAYGELEGYLSRKDKELEELRREQRLSRLEQEAYAKQAQAAEAQRQSELEKLVEAFENDPKAAAQTLVAMEQAHQQDLLKVRQEVLETVDDRLLRESKDYRDNQAVIDSLMQDEGMSFKQALNVTRRIMGQVAPKKPAHPPRPKPPVAGQSRPAGIEAPPAKLSAAQLAAMSAMGLGEYAEAVAKRLATAEK